MSERVDGMSGKQIKFDINPERWSRMKRLFAGAMSIATERREAFLAENCPDDPELLQEVRGLLSGDARAGSILERRAPQPLPCFSPGDMAGGRFRIVRMLGRGGMGEVYEAEDTLLAGEHVALKAMRSDIAADPATVVRFRQEIQLARRITHPNVCRIFDLELHGEDPVSLNVFLTMELLTGETLACRLSREGALPQNEALEIAVQMAQGLDAAHRCGVMHRDFKSSNVMLVPTSEGGVRVVITDFGLARGELTSLSADKLTGSGAMIGTLEYMAPEQLETGESSFRSDIYSLGLVLFEMVTGSLPFAGPTPFGSALRRVRDGAPSPLTLRPDLDSIWESVIGRCLNRDPLRRFARARDVADALKSGSVPAIPAGTLESYQRRRNRKVLWPPALVVVLVAIALWQMVPVRRPTPGVGKSVPLTSYDGVEFQPALSPDGKLVAFAWNGEKRDNVDIYVKQITSGTVSRLTTHPALEFSPAWSPDGSRIAFRRVLDNGTSRVVVKSYLGGVERQIAEWPYDSERHTQGLSRDLCWSPDGKWLIAAGRAVEKESTSLYKIAVETGDVRRLTFPPGRFGDTSPALSPDGRSLAFSRFTDLLRSELYLLDVSEDLSPATTPVPLTTDNRLALDPVWSTDGQEIIFSSDRSREYSHVLWKLKVPRFRPPLRPLRPDRIQPIEEPATNPTLSQQGHRMAYSQVTRDMNIWEAPLVGSGAKAGPANEVIHSTRIELFPDVSPDGTRIAFSSNRSGHQEIWVCGRDGSNATQLTSFDGPPATDPHWSLDGSQILFVHSPDIYVVSPHGGAPRVIHHCGGDCGAPNWSRDGTSIYFGLPAAGLRQIWKVPVTGGTPVQITRGGGVFGIESADGKNLFYAKARGLFSSVWKVPANGGVEEQVLPEVSFGRNFAVTSRGIYFIRWSGHLASVLLDTGGTGETVDYLDFTTGTVRTVITTRKPVYLGLALSPGERSLLFTQIDVVNSDLWLIEEFR
ncbi:MAG: protein kinase [Bryobacteraceae bacterium]